MKAQTPPGHQPDFVNLFIKCLDDDGAGPRGSQYGKLFDFSRNAGVGWCGAGGVIIDMTLW